MTSSTITYAPSPQPIGEDDNLQFDISSLYITLQSAASTRFDHIATIAAQVSDAPMALICFADQDRRWVKGIHGISIEDLPKGASPWERSDHRGEPLRVSDATQDLQLAGCQIVMGSPGVRMYIEVPLIASEGVTIGFLCVMDTRARTLPSPVEKVLRLVAEQAVALVELCMRESALANDRMRGQTANDAAALSSGNTMSDQTTTGLQFALLDIAGTVLWTSFHSQKHSPSRSALDPTNLDIGSNYFDVIREAARSADTLAVQVDRHMAKLIFGQIPSIEIQYGVQGPGRHHLLLLGMGQNGYLLILRRAL